MPADASSADQTGRGLDDPRALEILTTEHWGLLSTRTLGYTEMFARATIYVASLYATLVAVSPCLRGDTREIRRA